MTYSMIEAVLFIVMLVGVLIFGFWMLRSAAKHERRIRKLGEEIEAKTGIRTKLR